MKIPTHTKGGHEITDFKEYVGDNPFCIDNNIKWVGRLQNEYTKKVGSCYWNAKGEVINRGLSQYDIEL